MSQASSRGEVAASAAAKRSDFETLFRRYYSPLVGFFLNRGLSRADSEDLAQDTLMRAFRGYDSFRRDSSDATWLFVIAGNCWLNHLRSLRTHKRKGETIALDEPLDEQRGDHAPHQRDDSFEDAGALKSILAGEQRRLVEEEIQQLPPQMRRSVTLYCSGLEHDDTAKILGVQTGTVKSLVSQAKARLIEALRRKHPELFEGGR